MGILIVGDGSFLFSPFLSAGETGGSGGRSRSSFGVDGGSFFSGIGGGCVSCAPMRMTGVVTFSFFSVISVGNEPGDGPRFGPDFLSSAFRIGAVL